MPQEYLLSNALHQGLTTLSQYDLGVPCSRKYFKQFDSCGNALRFHAKIVEVEIGGVAIYCPIGNFTELNSTVTYMVLKAKANDRCTSSPFPQ
ncbi:hypothetical protein TNCV_1187751 [Trichonephila clavipes]|nr:hypothetical protein TNCV_1187751 [Trichonephila clavipes]